MNVYLWIICIINHLQITSLQKALQSIPSASAVPPTSSAVATPISTGSYTHHPSSSLPLHMLNRPTTSSVPAPLDQSANTRTQTSNPSLSMSSTSRNNGIINI